MGKQLEGTLEMQIPNLMIQKSAAGASTYVFEQASAADLWIIEHNLNRYPSCTVVDSAGTAVVGEVEYVNRQTIHVHFTAKFSGMAYLN